MKKNIAFEFLSLFIGAALFFAIIKLAGLEKILGLIQHISPGYLFLYILMALATTHWAAAYRWKYVLQGEDVNVSVWTLLKYKAIIFSINYLTPVARIGGEPLKILLLKRQKIKTPKSFASIIIDNFLGMGIDVAIAGFVLITLVFTAAKLSGSMKGLFLGAGIAFPLAVVIVYFLLRKREGIFSSIFRGAGRITRTRNSRSYLAISKAIARSEFYMRRLLVKHPKSMLFAMLYAAMSWPLTIIQFKLALLALGFDVSLIQIIMSIIMVNITLLMPIPAALGIQEAGQLSTFQLFSSSPYMGVALSLLLRFKDMILLLISFLFISREGASIFQIANRKITSFIKNK